MEKLSEGIKISFFRRRTKFLENSKEVNSLVFEILKRCPKVTSYGGVGLGRPRLSPKLKLDTGWKKYIEEPA